MPRPPVRPPNGRGCWTMFWPAHIGCGPGPPHDTPMASFGTFFQDVDAASSFYRHLLAQLRRRWALERSSLWDTLGPSSGLKEAQAVERSLFERPAFIVAPAAGWPTP